MVKVLLSLITVFIAGASTISASAIFSPVSAVVNSGGTDPSTSITNTFNRSGLSVGFTSGVTNFDTYLAGNPTHTLGFSGAEWFSASGTTTASVTYDLGSILSIDRLALWNEESAGIGSLNLLYSTDNSVFTPLVTGFAPPDNPLADYPATIVGFGSVNARWVRFDMSGCPQANPATFAGCAIGEVAFSVAPEPGSVFLLSLGLTGLIVARLRRAKA